MTNENMKPENMLALLEQNKGSLAAFITGSWKGTGGIGKTHAEHFAAFHLSLIKLIQTNARMAFNITLAMLAEHLLPLLTDEEKEALRNESVNPQGVNYDD